MHAGISIFKEESMIVIKYGVERLGHWNSEKLIKQVEDVVIKIVASYVVPEGLL